MDDPQKYAKEDDISRHHTGELIKEFHDEIKAMHGRIADIGCGPATVTRDVLLPHLPDDAVIVDLMRYRIGVSKYIFADHPCLTVSYYFHAVLITGNHFLKQSFLKISLCAIRALTTDLLRRLAVDMDAAKEWAERDDFTRRNTDELLKEFHGEIKVMHGRIADIGCGPATVTRNVLLPNLPEDAVIVGIDKTREMIKYAEENHKDEKRLSFLQFDIESDEFPVNLIENYDHATAFFLFHWCQKTNVMLKNIYKLLRPGGTVLSISFSRAVAFEIYFKFEKNPKYSVYVQNATRSVSPHSGLPSPEKHLKKDLEKAGFEVLHCTNRLRTFSHETLNNLLDLLMAATSFFNQMPEHLKKEYREDVARELMKKYSVDENNVDSKEFPVTHKYEIMVAHFKKPIEQ